MALFSRKKSRTEGASDPAKLLITEHEKVERLFAELESAAGAVERQGLIAQLDAELSAHTAKEEAYLYPWVVGHVPGGGKLIDHANHEHGLAKQALGDLVSMDPGDEGLLAVASRLQGLVEAHVKEEEKALFPALAKSATGEELASLRADLEAAKFTGVERDLPAEPATRSASSRKATAKKATAKKASARKATAKKATAKKATAKAAGRGSASRAGATLASSGSARPAKKAAAKTLGSTKKATAKKATAKKAPAKKTTAKKAAAKKATAKKAGARRR